MDANYLLEVKCRLPLYILDDMSMADGGIYSNYAVGDKGCYREETFDFFSFESKEKLCAITRNDGEYSVKIYKEKCDKLPHLLRNNLKVVMSSGTDSVTVYADNKDIYKFVGFMAANKLGL
jgi:hypothetical protein